MTVTNLHDVTRELERTWNVHDMDAFGQLLEPEATFVNRFATYWRGRDEIVAGHRQIHEGVYRDSTLAVDAPDVDRLTDDIAVLHFWCRASIGSAHPAGPHQVDTLIMAVARHGPDGWRLRAVENVTLTDPRSGQPVLR